MRLLQTLVGIGLGSLCACGGGVTTLDARISDATQDAIVSDVASEADAQGNDFAHEGEVCGAHPEAPDAGVPVRPCAEGLVCCYPCGIPGCNDICRVPCTDQSCTDGCPLVP